jgi:transmembrane sensor
MISHRKRPTPSAAARAEAAAWVARLHGPNRTEEVEAGLRRWLADDPDHTAAFELLTDAWERSAQLKRRPLERIASWERVGFRMSFSRVALATACTFVFAVIATLVYLHTDAVSTGVGEYRTLALEDGTRVHLNTDTRVVIRFDKHSRRVALERGEALFEVAKRPDWPFVVSAAGREIRALGTAFMVRTDDGQLAVTLVEGKVAVSGPGPITPTSNPMPGISKSNQAAETGNSAGSPITLSPGQRLTLAAASAAKIDQPSLDRVTAWEYGQVSFDNTPLGAAIAEMNRYSRTRIILSDAVAADVRISGIFEAGDSANFAKAVARTYRLQVSAEGRSRIVLTKLSESPAIRSHP